MCVVSVWGEDSHLQMSRLCSVHFSVVIQIIFKSSDNNKNIRRATFSERGISLVRS